MKKIRGIWAVLSTSLLLPFLIVIMYIFPSHHRKIRRTSKIFFWLNGLKVERIGEFDNSAQILILNHQGIMDIVFLEANYPWDICWVAKKELGELPIFGHALKAPKMILIDRESKKSLVFLLREAKKKLDEGRILAIFPEGTRGKGGENLLPFKNGAKMLVEKYRLKIQPIVLINTRKLFDDKLVEISANSARAVCLEAFLPDFENPKWYEELRENMQEIYLKHYHELNG